MYGGTDNYGVENFNSSYSSHVIYGRENQNDEELEESSKFSGIVDGSRGSVDREVINFEENSRNFRRGGNTRKGKTGNDASNKIQKEKKSNDQPENFPRRLWLNKLYSSLRGRRMIYRIKIY